MHPFSRSYFQGVGYKGLFLDFPLHYAIAEDVLKRNPQSILEVGGARGYICRILQSHGVKAVCMDISEHCLHTKAIDNFVLHDATVVPWKFKDGEFDLCFSKDFMEHLPEEKVSTVIKEMARVSHRGLHKITFAPLAPNDTDPTHKDGTIKPREWWLDKFKEVAPGYPVEVEEKDLGIYQIDLGKHAPPDGLVKVNIGCFLDMFHYGWENLDSQNLSEFARINGYIFRQVDVKNGIPKPDNSVDIILSSHMIEHLNREDGLKFLTECMRALKPNGLIRLAIPDTQLLCKKYLKREITEYKHVNVGVENAPDDVEALYHLLLAGHQTIYDYDSLKKVLEKTGFQKIKRMEAFKSQSEAIQKQTIPAYPTLSCYAESFKPETSMKVTSKAKLKSEANSKLKIGLISAPFLKVPPDAYGGAEMIIADLAEILAKKHEVTIFAPDGSKVEGCEIVGFGPAIKEVHVDWLGAERQAYEKIQDKLEGFDVIHDHTWFGWAYKAKTLSPNLKICHTHHGGLTMQWWGRSKPPFKLNMIAISQWMKNVYERQGFTAKYVYNGVNMKKYPFKAKKGKRLLYVGRFSTFKQPHIAIEIAKTLNMPIDLVGGSFVDDPAYLNRIKGMCNGDDVKMYLDASHETKIKLLENAKCLLFPSRMGEPFGLVAVEAMACGTPVVALNDGAISEIVKEGGIVCQDADAMVDALKQIDGIHPKDCRKNAMRFSREIMAKNYLKCYMDILSGAEW